MLQLLQGHVSSKDAHEMMMLMVMPCYDHAQMMLKCKANTWGVTASVSCASAGDAVVLGRCTGLGTCAREGQGEGWLGLGHEAAFLLFFLFFLELV
jgi:hypothetical protein